MKLLLAMLIASTLQADLYTIKGFNPDGTPTVKTKLSDCEKKTRELEQKVIYLEAKIKILEIVKHR